MVTALCDNSSPCQQVDTLVKAEGDQPTLNEVVSHCKKVRCRLVVHAGHGHGQAASQFAGFVYNAMHVRLQAGTVTTKNSTARNLHRLLSAIEFIKVCTPQPLAVIGSTTGLKSAKPITQCMHALPSSDEQHR